MRLVSRPCAKCRTPFTGKRGLKYCSNPCRDAVAREQRARWEEEHPRHTHKYRTRQLELPLDMPRTDA